MWIVFTRIGIVRRLLRDARLTWRLFRDPRTPLKSKMILVGTVVLVVSPINWIPNLIPVIGQLEDLALLSAGMEMFLKSVPRDLKDEHEARLGRRSMNQPEVVIR